MIEHLNKDGFVWWQGVVVDRNDPFKIGRCRVRILGYHDDENNIPDDHLPWAYPAMPINVRPNSVATGLVEGVWVLGFFRDGNDAQEPVITHLINYGKQKDGDFQVRSENTGAHPTGGMNTNRLAQGDSKDTVIDNIHNDDLLIGDTEKKKDIAAPISPYAAQFPHNYVEESESGHVIQIDDTENAERLSVTHRAGTFIEVHPDGTQVAKIVGDRFTIILGDDSIRIDGDYNLIINGEFHTNMEKRVDEIGGDKLDIIGGNLKEEVTGAKEVESDGFSLNSGGGGVDVSGSGSTNISTNGTTIKGGIINLN